MRLTIMDFKKVDNRLSVSGQTKPRTPRGAQSRKVVFRYLFNNRPDGEQADRPAF